MWKYFGEETPGKAATLKKNKMDASKRGSEDEKWLEMAQNYNLHSVVVVSEFNLWNQLPDLEKKI